MHPWRLAGLIRGLRMKFKSLSVFVCSALFVGRGMAQAEYPAMVVQAGHEYRPLSPVVAPGELMSLVVHGVGTNLTSIVLANRKPLPSDLAGISVVLQQSGPFGSVAVPIYSVIPLPACNYQRIPPFSPACGTAAGITVQIPFELWTLGPLPFSPRLTIFENGVKRAGIDLGVQWHNVHIATTGDDVQVQFPELQTGWLAPVIRSLDRQHFVSQSNPALPGETLSMWVVGLGQGVGAIKAETGAPAPDGVVVEPGINYQWGKNLKPRPVNWPSGSPRPSEGIVSAGMIPGQVGIYEIVFKVPDTIPPDVPPCIGDTYTNLTVSIGYQDSFDGASICVTQPAATARSQMAKALVRGLYQKLGLADPDSFPFAQSPPHYSDVPESLPLYKYMQRIAELQIASDNASDCDPGAFCPDAQSTNGQIAVWVVRAMQLRSDPCVSSETGCDVSIADSFTINSETPYFRDVSASHPYFRWIQKARELNLIRPEDVRCAAGAGACTQPCPQGSFCPSGTTTVGQMTLWVGRAFFEFGR